MIARRYGYVKSPGRAGAYGKRQGLPGGKPCWYVVQVVLLTVNVPVMPFWA